MEIDVRTICESNTIAGLPVRTLKGQLLGEVKATGICRESHHLAYAVLSLDVLQEFQGRLFVVSGRDLTLKQEGDHPFVVLRFEPKALRSATVFRRYYWPGMINPQWAAEIDNDAQWLLDAEHKLVACGP
jgi:hypothetical protein